MHRGKVVVSEDRQQEQVFRWARLQRIPDAEDVEPGSRVADYLYHPPNGGQRGKVTAARLQAQGVKSGVSDLHLPLARHGFHGLWIELKAEDGSVTARQQQWLDRMSRAGHMAVVCFGWGPAVETIRSYLGICESTTVGSRGGEGDD